MKHLPIGFIDSGYGGLTVVKQSLRQLPNESIIYVGDNARAPYGPRSLTEVKQYIWQLTNFLREKGIKMLVIACNTGTAAALDDLRQTLAIPVVGVIHSGCRAAIKQTKIGHIGVIGTQGTIDSGMYRDTLQEKSAKLNIQSVAAPEFVEIVEQNQIEDPAVHDIVQNRLAPFIGNDVDTLVLGCTHYPLMKQAIQDVVGSSVYLIDSGRETINEVSTLLDYFHLSRSAEEAAAAPPTQQFYTTGNPRLFARFAQKWLNDGSVYVHPLEIKGEYLVDNHTNR